MIIRNSPCGSADSQISPVKLLEIYKSAKKLEGSCKIVKYIGTIQQKQFDVSIFQDENGNYWYNRYQVL